jgi:hypothetical protein
VVDEPAPDERDGLESPMGVLRKSRDRRAVIHPPAIDPGEVVADLASLEGGRRPHVLVARGIVVDVVNAEEERVGGRPLEAERSGLEH